MVILLLLVLCAVLAGYCTWLKENEKEVIEINDFRQRQNAEIERTNAQLKQEKEQLNTELFAQKDMLQDIANSAKKMREEARNAANETYEATLKEIEARFEEQKAALAADFNSKRMTYNSEITALVSRLQEEGRKLKDIEDKQLAYLEAEKRKAQIESDRDYYRLAISEADIADIKGLRELQLHFCRKETIDKIIWEVYYKPAYDILMSHLFSKSTKVCGIYKITDLTTGQAYIGQSVDIRERFRQHIKTSLTFGKGTNKLYQTLQKSEQYNFTFEILEEVERAKLNERETYWIDFYKTKEYGLNSTKGGA